MPETLTAPPAAIVLAHRLGELLREDDADGFRGFGGPDDALEWAGETLDCLMFGEPNVATLDVRNLLMRLGERLLDEPAAGAFRAGFGGRPVPQGRDDVPVCRAHGEVQPCSHPVHDRGDR